jgi:putative hydrolase of the HAD superfamily
MVNTIIFDFGGVITIEGFSQGLIKSLKLNYSFDESLFLQRFKKHEEGYMRDEMDSKAFWEKICAGFGIPYEAFASAFVNSYRLNPEMLELIKKLKSKYRIIMLSDNFDILSQKLKSESSLKDLFERMFFSNEIKQIKNHPDAFKYVLNQISEQPENCVFIDDKEKNLIHARSQGIKPIHFKDASTFPNQLESMGVII